MTVTDFYSFNKVLSFNATFNFIVGNRGAGKTYGWQKRVIGKAIKTFEKDPENIDMFIYMRRYKEELQFAKLTFFAAIQVEFPKWDFRVNGFTAQMAPAHTRDDKKRHWYDIGYFMELSRAQAYKSAAFPKVKDIGYDEFILEKSHTRYLPNEAAAFNGFYSTVDRNKDKTRVCFMANSVSITNPYFIEYDINPNNADKDGFIKTNAGYCITHFINNKEFSKQVYETKWGQFIQGTEFGNFAVENEFVDNHDGLIDEKNSRARYMFTLETSAGTFSIWFDIVSGNYFCQSKRPKGDETLITLLTDRMDENKTLMRTTDSAMSRLRTAFNHGRVWFDKPPTRNAFLEIYR